MGTVHICLIILVVQPWVQQEGAVKKENSTDRNQFRLNETICNVQISSHPTKDEMDAMSEINITLCEQNRTDSLKISQTDNTKFVFEIFG